MVTGQFGCAMKNRLWRNVLVVSALASCWGLLSCDKPPAMMPCNMILPTALTSVPFLDARDADRATNWIRANWGADALSVDSPGPSYSWHDSGHRYSADFGPTDQWINVVYSEPPSIAAIIGCFGSPTSYSIIERPAETWARKLGFSILNEVQCSPTSPTAPSGRGRLTRIRGYRNWIWCEAETCQK